MYISNANPFLGKGAVFLSGHRPLCHQMCRTPLGSTKQRLSSKLGDFHVRLPTGPVRDEQVIAGARDSAQKAEIEGHANRNFGQQSHMNLDIQRGPSVSY